MEKGAGEGRLQHFFFRRVRATISFYRQRMHRYNGRIRDPQTAIYSFICNPVSQAVISSRIAFYFRMLKLQFAVVNIAT